MVTPLSRNAIDKFVNVNTQRCSNLTGDACENGQVRSGLAEPASHRGPRKGHCAPTKPFSRELIYEPLPTTNPNGLSARPFIGGRGGGGGRGYLFMGGGGGGI
eukprot:SAG31_NODE_29003_length_402_cov_0.867987_1_plen_102_part_10